MPACEAEKKEDTIIVSVGNSSLTKSELDNYLGVYKLNKDHREEFVRRWIERELLYNEALKQGIPNSEFYRLSAEVSNKELAASFFIKDYFESNSSAVISNNVEKYFNSNREQFKLNEEAVIINYASFSDIDDAIGFRTDIFKQGWVKSTDSSEQKNNHYSNEVNKLFLRRELPTERVVRIIDNLLPGEISIVFESEPNIYTVVQLVEFLAQDSTPELAYIEEEVIERYSMMERKRLYNQFVKDLYSKYNIEINRDTE
jgi:hypothetical protein